MIRSKFLSKKSSLNFLSCVASIVLLASCSSSGSDGGSGSTGGTGSGGTGSGGTGTGTGVIITETDSGSTTTGTGTGGGGGTTIGTGTGDGGGTTIGTGTGDGGSTDGGNNVDTDSIVGLWELTSIEDASQGLPLTQAPPGAGYLDIGVFSEQDLSFILMIANPEVNCLDVIVATPITPAGGSNFVDAAEDVVSISRGRNGLTVSIQSLTMTFAPVSGITFSDLQLCEF